MFVLKAIVVVVQTFREGLTVGVKKNNFERVNGKLTKVHIEASLGLKIVE